MTIKNIIQKIHKYSTQDVINFIESNYSVKVKEMISIALYVNNEDHSPSSEILFAKFINSNNQLRFVRINFDGKKLIPLDKSEVLPASKAMEMFCKIIDEPYDGSLKRAIYWKMMVVWGAWK